MAGQPSATTMQPAATANTPPRFSLGGKVVTAQEAESMLRAAAELTAQNETLRTENQHLTGVREHALRIMNNSDAQSFIALATEAGWPKEKINTAIQSAHAVRDGKIGVIGGNGQPGKNPTGNGQNGAAGGGRVRSHATDDEVDQSVAELRDIVGQQSTTIREMQGLIKTQHEILARTIQTVDGSFKGNVWEKTDVAVAADPVLAEIIKNNPRAGEDLKRLARDAADQAVKTRGGFGPKVLEDAVAKARERADTYGLLNPPNPGTIPSLGGAPSSGQFQTLELKKDVKPEELSDVMSPDFKLNLASALLAG